MFFISFSCLGVRWLIWRKKVQHKLLYGNKSRWGTFERVKIRKNSEKLHGFTIIFKLFNDIFPNRVTNSRVAFWKKQFIVFVCYMSIRGERIQLLYLQTPCNDFHTPCVDFHTLQCDIFGLTY